MIRRLLALALAAACVAPAMAQTEATPGAAVEPRHMTVVAVRPLRARSTIEPDDVRLKPSETPGPYDDLDDVVGMEARATIYAGRAVHPADIGPAAVVERNALVSMRFVSGGLSIVAEGRAMGRAGVGERVRVMNMDSRTTVTGRVVAPGLVEVK